MEFQTNSDQNIEYWKEMFSIGNVAFNGSNKIGLKSVFKTVISTPLLNYIECLTANVDCKDSAPPFSCWMLQGLLSIASCEKSVELSTLCIEAHSKIFTALLECSPKGFHRLCLKYIETVNEICQIEEFPVEREFLLLERFSIPEYNIILTPAKCRFHSVSDCSHLLLILIEVLCNLRHTIIEDVVMEPVILLELIQQLFELDDPDIHISCLPLIQSLLKNVDDLVEDILEKMKQKLIKLFTNQKVVNNIILQQLVMDIWKYMKTGSYSVTKCDENVLNYLFNFINKYQHMNSFAVNEIGEILKKMHCFQDVISIINKFEVNNLPNKLLLLEDCIINDIQNFLKSSNFIESLEHSHNKLDTTSSQSYVITDISNTWKYVFEHFQRSYIGSKSNVDLDYLSSLHQIIKSCGRILGKLNSKFDLFKFDIILKFFDNCFGQLLNDVIKRSLCESALPHGDVIRVLASLLVDLFYLPECELLSSEDLAIVWRFVTAPWENISVFNVSSVYFCDTEVINCCLKSIRVLKQKLPSPLISRIFHQYVTDVNKNVNLAKESVISVPYLYLTGKYSPPRLITDILHPALLSDNVEVMSTLISSMADFVCCLAGTGFMSRSEDGVVKIHCCECSESCKVTGKQGRVSLVEPHLLKFLSLLAVQDVNVVRHFLDVVPRLTMHMTSLRNKESLNKWLCLLRHKDETVRNMFSINITNILFGRSWVLQCKTQPVEQHTTLPDVDESLSICFDKIEECLHLSLKSDSEYSYMKCTVLETLTTIACFPTDQVLKPSLLLLMNFIGNLQAPVSAVLLHISSSHRTTPLVLYQLYKPELSNMIANLIVLNYHRYGHSLRTTVGEIIAAFKGLCEVRFAEGNGKFIVPVLLVWAVSYKELEPLLSQWAEFVKEPLGKVLSVLFENVYTHVMLSQSPDVVKKCVKLVEKHTSVKFTEHVTYNQKNIINLLLYNYHREPDKVIKCLRSVMSEISQGGGKEAIADALQSRFVGYLLFIVSKFVKELSPEHIKIHSIKSLSSVIQLMGKKHITPVARKVLATLQTTLSFNNKDVYMLHYQAWDRFVHNVDVAELGPLLPAIVSTLLPLFDKIPQQVGQIFDYLIIKNEKSVSKHLPSLFFIPDKPETHNCYIVIQKYANIPGESLKDRLNREISLSLHEAVTVRVEGLKALFNTMKTSANDIYNLIVDSDELDPSIISLIDALIACCNDSDPNISLTASCCLGELGAVDPGLLPRKQKRLAHRDPPLSVHEPQFVFLAITEVVRGFQNARNSIDMDAFALAIQELLKSYNVSPTPDNEIWSRFPGQSQNLMMPLFTSLYKGQTPTRSNWPDVIFGCKEAATHMEWACLWASKLIGLGKDDKSTCIFRVCEPSFKRDAGILQFMLQYIILQAIMQDSVHHSTVKREMEAVLNWTPETITDDSSASRPIRLIDYCGYPNFKSSINVSEVKSCSMTIFMLFDFLQFWLRMYRSKQCTPSGEHLRRTEYVTVKSFIDNVDYLKIASTNYELGEYTRAIMYLEDVISSNSSLTQHLPFLKKLYLLYGDLDCVAGATNMLTTAPSLEDTLLSHQAAGQLEEVRIVYERLGQDGTMTPGDVQEMAKCYLNLGEPFTAVKYIKSMMQQQPDLVSVLSECMTDCLIKLSDYDQLSTFLTSSEVSRQTGWDLSLGRIFVNMKQGKEVEFMDEINYCRSQVANAFKQSGLQFGDYRQGYPHAVRLQVLNEIENFYHVLNVDRDDDDLIELIKQRTSYWTNRSGLIQSNPVSLEPLLSVRRTLLALLQCKLQKQPFESIINQEISQYWVKSAEVARKSGCFHQSYNYILSAERFKIPAVFIEKAQLYWEKGDQDLSLHTLSRGLAEFFPGFSSDRDTSFGSSSELDNRKLCAEAKLLYAVYNEDVSNCDYNTNMANYQDAYRVCKQLEKTEVYLAQCLDRVVGHMISNDMDASATYELCICMVHHFGRSLHHGCEYIYQSVPRMLSVWLDMGEKIDKPEKLSVMNKINKLIVQASEKLPPFILMTALPQLLSRLCHPHRDVFHILKSILVILVKAFPQQCLWAMQLVAKSSIPERVKRYTEVVQDPRLRSSLTHSKLIADFTTLCDKLNRLTNRSVPMESLKSSTPTISMFVSALPQLFASETFSSIIIPITRFCSITLPRKQTTFSHDSFPKQAVYIEGIQEEINILTSLQKPKKITFRGSDGNLYDILCKPKDDLRRDGRLMEFNNIVNMYLHRDPDSRARALHIRTYVVTPLGENGGLIEWVPNLIGMRPALLKLYQQIGKHTTNKTLKSLECNVRDPLETKRSAFLEKMLPLHPPVLQEWFRLTFPEPSDWYVARQSFIRTTAVISMVGYILGLGDRHGENILLDSESGDTIHVDFNCLFNKGERFDWKERVPFRLTHNMVTAMGPLGAEGPFRKSCEISLRVFRSQVKTLMSVLTPFAYDPFGSWGKNKEINQNDRDQKIAEALSELNDIEKRLNGSLRVKQKNSSFYLSVEGQVRSLIAEATDVDNLCQMYIGWSAFM